MKYFKYTDPIFLKVVGINFNHKNFNNCHNETIWYFTNFFIHKWNGAWLVTTVQVLVLSKYPEQQKT